LLRENVARLAVTVLLMWQWRGIDFVVWNGHNQMLRVAMWTLFAIGCPSRSHQIFDKSCIPIV
jgi:hypothetical protein